MAGDSRDTAGRSAILDLCDEYVREVARLDPVAATMRGITADPGSPPFGSGTDYSPEGSAAQADLERDILRRLARLRREEPTDPIEAVAAEHLHERLSATLAWHDAGENYRALRAPFGRIQQIRDSVDLLPRTDDDAWAIVVERLRAVPGMLTSWRTSLTAGLDRGIVAARRQAVEGAAQADRYAATATHDALVRAYGEGALADDLAAAARAAHTAYAEIARFLRDDYAPRARAEDAVGRETYVLAARLTLGTDLDPEEAYAWGWEELHRIETELAAEAARIRPGATLEEVTALLGETEYVEGLPAYQQWLQDRHDEAVERLHGVHFDIPEGLRRIDVTLAHGSSAGAPYYTPPSEDLSRPGRTWWPLGGRERFETWRELTTVFHEGVPGHHLQLGTARVARDRLSRFARTSGISGHGEGWALYAERLADELGWFTPPGTRLGMLKGSAVRAARVVIDIGLHLDLPLPPAEAARHGPRWTFDVATKVLRDRGGLVEHRVHPEIVRYCGWPGQAPSYKLGERAWLAAREDARRRLGARFDLRRWHTDALRLGPIGLAGLRRQLARLTGTEGGTEEVAVDVDEGP